MQLLPKPHLEYKTINSPAAGGVPWVCVFRSSGGWRWEGRGGKGQEESLVELSSWSQLRIILTSQRLRQFLPISPRDCRRVIPPIPSADQNPPGCFKTLQLLLVTFLS